MAGTAAQHRRAERLWLEGWSAAEVVEMTGLSPVVVGRLTARIDRASSMAARARRQARATTDDTVKAEVRGWVMVHGLPCTPRRWTDTARPGQLTAASLIARYGTWAKVMRLAGVPYRRQSEVLSDAAR